MFEIVRGRKGQLTLLDLIVAPIVAVVLSALAIYFLQGSTAHLVTAVNYEPSVEGCNYMLDAVYGNYYVHGSAALSMLKALHPDQYFAATSESLSNLSTNCGVNCSISYATTPNTLVSTPSLYVDFLNYFTPFSVSVFNLTTINSYPILKDYNMQVFLNSVPALSYVPSQVCYISVYNPEDPSEPYLIYGVMK
ncbi:MAG: hypothetical protein QXU98_10400 [Candidatus Parvarchaeota archaeon]